MYLCCYHLEFRHENLLTSSCLQKEDHKSSFAHFTEVRKTLIVNYGIFGFRKFLKLVKTQKNVILIVFPFFFFRKLFICKHEDSRENLRTVFCKKKINQFLHILQTCKILQLWIGAFLVLETWLNWSKKKLFSYSFFPKTCSFIKTI